mmetsp:Transcript_32132/g.91142  ORF Transcript_32132/g.91142 Transcript_32132/m.91142 type:complete len:164 (+) Transcript_32132:95-586(+)|eukprot:CAMPEP_0117680110 /NCGR_PEP_ID=MMETSP0804-20121206/18165_1 /TAXON_ID=1074897 /ORGANISM="Tetraselmis astigmatica, Strain CCMP880" /LENGTH=163 /DNA_ID=CAMNT_0005489561 /DNA_START=46 /DNA_END=537 /DNA_ORIENTATION=-
MPEILTLSNGLEYAVLELPKPVVREAAHVFPGVDLEGVLAVPTCQRSDVDLARTGEVIEQEKDRLLERFMHWAKAVCEQLQAWGHWADYIDPCSGLPMINGGQQVYSEVDGMTAMLGYQTANAGCCKVLLHPKWGSSVYPATMFTNAPREKLQEAMQKAPVPK